VSFISLSIAFYWDLSWCLSFRTVLHFTETCHGVFHFALYRILLRPVTVLQTNLSLLFVLSQLLCSKLNLFCIYLRMLIFENAYIWECLYLRMLIFENAYIWECLYLRMLIFEIAFIWEKKIGLKTNTCSGLTGNFSFGEIGARSVLIELVPPPR